MSITTSKPILVTGITGYVAAWIVLQLLRKGYRVRGTTRSQKKFDDLCKVNVEFQMAVEEKRLENIIIEDISNANIDQAMEGVEVVMHTASPFHFKGGEPTSTYLNPALHGTLNVLQAADRSQNVKKFILTSSFAAIFDLADSEFPLNSKSYTESDWNSATFDSAKNSENPAYAYCASKTIAEKAMYDYVEQCGLEDKMQICSINPPLIFGPWIHAVPDLNKLNESVDQIYQLISGNLGQDIPITHFPCMIDVRDVARAHILAMENEQAKGRYLIGKGSVDNEWVCQFTQTHFPQYYKGPRIEYKTANGISNDKRCFVMDCSKAKNELGMTTLIERYKTMFDMITQMENFETANK